MFQDRESIQESYQHVFKLFAYQELSAEAKSIIPEEVSAYVKA